MNDTDDSFLENLGKQTEGFIKMTFKLREEFLDTKLKDNKVDILKYEKALDGLRDVGVSLQKTLNKLRMKQVASFERASSKQQSIYAKRTQELRRQSIFCFNLR